MGEFTSKLFDLLLTTHGGTLLGAAARWVARQIFGGPEPSAESAVMTAIGIAQERVHAEYGEMYGSRGSTFIDRARNQAMLLRSSLPSKRRLISSDLDPRGFDDGSQAPPEVVDQFLNWFYTALEAADSRELDRDIALQEMRTGVGLIGSGLGEVDRNLKRLLHSRILPEPIRKAIAEPDLAELSDLMNEGRLEEAIGFVRRRVESIEDALKGSDPDGVYAEALRAYRQRLMFAAASAESWLGNIDAGREWWHRASELGPIAAEGYRQAGSALFNLGLSEELRRLFSKVSADSEAHGKLAPLVALASADWHSADLLLADAQGPDLFLARASARVYLLNPQQSEEVKRTVELIAAADRGDLLPTLRVAAVKVTYDLLVRVCDSYTVLDYDRRPLVDALTVRAARAVDATRGNNNLTLQALVLLASAAELLRDKVLGELLIREVDALSDEIRSRAFFRLDPTPSLDEIDEMLRTEKIDKAQALSLRLKILKAEAGLDEVERELRAGVFEADSEGERAAVLRLLVLHLQEQGRQNEALHLVEETPLKPRDRWLLRWMCLPKHEFSWTLAEEAEREFSLDVQVLERLSLSSLQILRSAEETSEGSAERIADAAIAWSSRFLTALPSRSVRLLHAETMLAAGLFEQVLEFVPDLDPVYLERKAEIAATALRELDKLGEAAQILLEAYERSPESESLAINTSAALLGTDREEEAARLLKPLVERGASAPGILVNYARSLLMSTPSSPSVASRAFDLLQRAYDVSPDRLIAAEAWKAARGAGRGAEATAFYAAMLEGAPTAKVESSAGLDEAFRLMESSSSGMVRIGGSIEPLLDLFRRDEERRKALEKLTSAHLAPYEDVLRLAGRSWLQWTSWTERFKAIEDDTTKTGGFSVLCDWSHARRAQPVVLEQDDGRPRLLLDGTALLTLGILGEPLALEILSAVKLSTVRGETMKRLREEMAVIESDILLAGEEPYGDAHAYLESTPEAVIPYSERLERASEEFRSLGAFRLELAATALEGGLYVTGRGEDGEWPVEAVERCITSASLLAALNASGKLTADEARRAAFENPKEFDGWEEVVPNTLAEVYVFSEAVLLAWTKAGLIPAIGKRLRVGPWCARNIFDQAFYRQSLSIAHKRLQGLIRALRKAVETGVVQELSRLEVTRGSMTEEAVDSHDEALVSLWPIGLENLRVAKRESLVLWADDRFYRILFAPVDPFRGLADTTGIRAELGEWAAEAPALSTFDLLDFLGRAGAINAQTAQRAAASLFEAGYRPAHPILLDFALQQFSLSFESGITPPFRRLADGISAIPSHLPPEHRSPEVDRLSRLVTVRVAEGFIMRVWQTSVLTTSQRCALSDSLLESVERVFVDTRDSHSLNPDRGVLYFWRALSMAFFSGFAQRDQGIDTEPHRWLGSAAARRAYSRQIVRLLEDNALDALKFSLSQSELEDTLLEPEMLEIGGRIGLRVMIPLLETELLGILDVLLRRTFGFVGELARQACTDTIHELTINGNTIREKVTEEEMELAAAEVLRRAGAGAEGYAEMIFGCAVAFNFARPIVGLENEKITIEVWRPLFVLLWNHPEQLRPLLLRLLILQLAEVDPSLAHYLITRESIVIGGNEGSARVEMKKIGVRVLRSGYFEIQRDIAHAAWRLRQFDGDQIARFAGAIGKANAAELVEYLSGERVAAIEEVVVPQVHLLGRFLTATSDGGEEEGVGNHVSSLLHSIEGESSHELASWIGSRVSLAESSSDPFSASFALWQLIAAVEEVGDVQFDAAGQRTGCYEWIAEYILSGLGIARLQNSSGRDTRSLRSALVASCLRLAAFACSGEGHIAYCSKMDEPLAAWLERVWLLMTKFQIVLLRGENDLQRAEEGASKAVEELGLARVDARVLDYFDPYVFERGGEEIEAALVLVAVLKNLPAERRESTPGWLSFACIERIAELARGELGGPVELQNNLKLAAPLRVGLLASEVVGRLAAGSDL